VLKLNEQELTMTMLRNSTTSFGWVHIIIHWISAIAVIGLFAVGWWMVELDYYSEWYRTAPDLHKSVGLTLLLVTVFRVFWKISNPSPNPLATKPIEKKAGHFAHTIIYILLFTIMISGYLISTADGRGIEWFGLFEVPSLGAFVENQADLAGDIHEWLAYTLIGLVLLHAGAALKHHFLEKNDTFKRMIAPIDKD
jgi:cytochrome b561